MEKKIVTTDLSCSGTSLAGYYPASYARLEALFGPPNGHESGDGKVSTMWVLEFEGSVVTLYDYKETCLYDGGLPTVREFRELPCYAWRVGAPMSRTLDLDDFFDALAGMLK